MGKKKLNRKKLNPQNPIFTGNKYTDEFRMQLFSYTQNELNENNNFYEKDYNGFTLNVDYSKLSLICTLPMKKFNNMMGVVIPSDILYSIAKDKAVLK